MSEVVCLGEALVDFMPARSHQTLREAGVLRRVAGGATANVAVALARQGVSAAFLGKVGDDPFGYFLRDTLAANRVDISHLLLSSEANTGMSFAWADAAANNEARYLFVRQPSAHCFIRSDEIDANWLAAAKVLQFGSILLATEPGATATYTALSCARAAGLLRCYDVNMRLPAWPDHASARLAMLGPLGQCDIVKLNRHELAFLTGETDPVAGAARLWQSETQLLVVTLDKDGCYYQSRSLAGFSAGFVVEVADTVGAGDSFMAAMLARLLAYRAGFAAALTDAETLAQICRYANAAGAIATTRPGAIPALPRRYQVAQFLSKIQG